MDRPIKLAELAKLFQAHQREFAAQRERVDELESLIERPATTPPRIIPVAARRK